MIVVFVPGEQWMDCNYMGRFGSLGNSSAADNTTIMLLRYNYCPQGAVVGVYISSGEGG